jgi:arylsulfatase A-like enzyme
MIDIMPTILGLLGITPEKDEMQGLSLEPCWAVPGMSPSRVAFTEVLARKYEQKSVRTDRYKYIVTIDQETVEEHGREHLPEAPPRQELYDLESDPGERSNLLEEKSDTKISEQAAMFHGLLRKHLADNLGAAEPVTLDQDTLEKLKALGYLDD